VCVCVCRRECVCDFVIERERDVRERKEKVGLKAIFFLSVAFEKDESRES
jgi:hypothetical protein